MSIAYTNRLYISIGQSIFNKVIKNSYTLKKITLEHTKLSPSAVAWWETGVKKFSNTITQTPMEKYSQNNYTYLLEGAMMHLSSGHSQFGESCSIPKLWPISWATVVATSPTTGLWSMFTPPENSKVQIGPFRALPTTPPSNCLSLHFQTIMKNL